MRTLTVAASVALAAAGLSPAATVEIEMRHLVAGQPLRLDSLRYEKAGGETFSVARLSYLISGVAFERADGTWFETKLDAAWIDAGGRRTSFMVEGVPPGDYRALRFHVGLAPEANHSDPASHPAGGALNPAVNNLHWNWQGGYIFLALEGHYRVDGELRGYLLHFARDPNRTEINLATKLALGDAALLTVDLDISTLFGAPRQIVFAKDGDSTHSREGDDLAARLKANLPGAYRLQAISTPIAEVPPPKVAPLYLPPSPEGFPFKMAGTFPQPALPMDNPLLKGRVELGEKLFNDPRLSRTGEVSCASCHHREKAFTDGLVRSTGVDGRIGEMNSMPLFNLAWKDRFFWDGRAPSLREQVLMPIESHDEMDDKIENVVNKLAGEAAGFERAFGDPVITAEKISLALEAFLLTLTSYDSKFDRAMAGRAELSDAERRGFELFMTEYEPRAGQFGADCFHCHGGALFSDHRLHNNGLQGNSKRFTTPSLRNIALTAPYMHDGRFASLEEVVAHYNSGLHRTDSLSPNLAKHPEGGLGLPPQDQAALVAFLESLTDPKYTDSR
ncbi:MAG: MbnP family protein [Verrucomicrobiales bacterium]